MDVPFVKMHGAGNDFIVIDDRATALRLPLRAVAALCSRRRGIGADGLILVLPSTAADFRMQYFNSDGGEADLCGNGARCAARFAYEHGAAGATMTFESRAGLVRAEILERGVRVHLGPVTDVRLACSLDGVAEPVHFGVCGVPHAVIVEADARRRTHNDFIGFARPIRNHPFFGAAGANINLVSVTGPGSCVYRTYERGVEDETLACGTGAVVVAAVLAHLGLSGTSTACETAGGDILLVDVIPAPGGASDSSLTGPAAVSFSGTFSSGDYEVL